jgi:Putative porin
MSGRYTLLFSLIILAPVVVRADTGTAALADGFDYSGWFRLRYDGTDEQSVGHRDLGRFAGRFRIATDAGDTLRLVFGLATGGDNPTSRNQSFGNGFSTSDIGLEFAYVDWSLSDDVHVYGGKMKNPLFRAGKAPLIWDSDVNPEGVALSYAGGVLFSNLGLFFVEQRPSGSSSMAGAVQAGAILPVTDGTKLTVGAGYLAYTETVGQSAFYNGRPSGNSVDSRDRYLYEYRDVEAFAQLDTNVSGWPLSVYLQLVRNTAVDTEDNGYAFGARIGSAHDKGDVEFSWTYMDIGADAVVGTFDDSDFGGGGTDHSGHLIKARYACSRNVAVAATGFINRVNRFTGSEHDYNRIQLDLEFKFE